MDENDGSPKRDLRAILSGYASQPATPHQRRTDAALTEYERGSGEGIAEIRAQLEKEPGNEKLLDWLAFALYSNNDLDEAVVHYQKLVDRFPDNTTYHYYLGNCFAKKGQVQRAIVEWKRVVQIDPYSRMGRKAAARVEQASQLLRLVVSQPEREP
jgi:predicted Zn-dependent protease